MINFESNISLRSQENWSWTRWKRHKKNKLKKMIKTTSKKEFYQCESFWSISRRKKMMSVASEWIALSLGQTDPIKKALV
jgi:hypothetical protein